ncbi:MAG TPA: hypothetical protein DEA50_05055 [Parvularcula sp.]|nr:hypothetical protein [Parvularcula sp.]
MGRALCAIPLVYFVGVAGFALINAADFAAATPQLLRYVAAPLVLAAAFAWALVANGGKRAAVFGAYGCAVLAALFMHEGVATAQLTRSVSANAAKLYYEGQGAAAFRQTLPPGATARACTSH